MPTDAEPHPIDSAHEGWIQGDGCRNRPAAAALGRIEGELVVRGWRLPRARNGHERVGQRAAAGGQPKERYLDVALGVRAQAYLRGAALRVRRPRSVGFEHSSSSEIPKRERGSQFDTFPDYSQARAGVALSIAVRSFRSWLVSELDPGGHQG